MSVIEKLAATVREDVELLDIRFAQGDISARSRAVDFTFVTDAEKQARAVAGYLADFGNASTSVSSIGDEYRVVASLDMPLDRKIILSVSGFMRCIAELFAVAYDGWGAVIASNEPGSVD